MKRHNFTKDELIKKEKLRKEHLHVWGQMAISLGILVDYFNFTPDEVKEYIEKYDELCLLYLNDKENVIDMLKNIEEYAGVNLLKFVEEK